MRGGGPKCRRREGRHSLRVWLAGRQAAIVWRRQGYEQCEIAQHLGARRLAPLLVELGANPSLAIRVIE